MQDLEQGHVARQQHPVAVGFALSGLRYLAQGCPGLDRLVNLLVRCVCNARLTVINTKQGKGGGGGGG